MWSSVRYTQHWEEWYRTKLIADTPRISVPRMTTSQLCQLSVCFVPQCSGMKQELNVSRCTRMHNLSAPSLSSSQLVTYNKRWSSVHLRADTLKSWFIFLNLKLKAHLTRNNFLFTKKKWEWKQEPVVSACSPRKRVGTKCCPNPKGKDAEVTRQQMKSELHTPSSWAAGSGSQDGTAQAHIDQHPTSLWDKCHALSAKHPQCPSSVCASLRQVLRAVC